MTVNVGLFDARIRLLLAAVLFVAALILIDKVATGASFVLAAVALILLATGLTRVCPLYSFLRFDSCPKVNVGR